VPDTDVLATHDLVAEPTDADPDYAYCRRCLGSRAAIEEIGATCPDTEDDQG
jgi:hypothetical protein